MYSTIKVVQTHVGRVGPKPETQLLKVVLNTKPTYNHLAVNKKVSS